MLGIKLVCFAFALTAAGDYERVDLGTYHDVYAANRAIALALDKYSRPDCDEYTLDVKVDGDTYTEYWKPKARWQARDVKVLDGYSGTRTLVPGEIRIYEHRRWKQRRGE